MGRGRGGTAWCLIKKVVLSTDPKWLVDGLLFE